MPPSPQAPSAAPGRRSRIRPRRAAHLAFDAMALSRTEALRQIQQATHTIPLSPEIQRLIAIFQVDGEELAERGVSYETLKALERNHPLLFLSSLLACTHSMG